MGVRVRASPHGTPSPIISKNSNDEDVYGLLSRE